MKNKLLTLMLTILLATIYGTAYSIPTDSVNESLHGDFVVYFEPAGDQVGEIVTIEDLSSVVLARAYLGPTKIEILYPATKETSRPGTNLPSDTVLDAFQSSTVNDKDNTELDLVSSGPEYSIYAVYVNGRLVGFLFVNTKTGQGSFTKIK